ncbi:lipopolysaccharide biosynthesis protein, partial [Daejeonella sp.]
MEETVQNRDNLSNQNMSDEITLKDLFFKFRDWWSYIISKWVIILTAGFLGGFLGLIYAHYKKPVYTAEFTFVLEVGKQGPELGYAGLASQFGIGMPTGGSGVFTGSNLLPLMKSRFIIEKTLLRAVNINNKKQTLAEFYIDINNLREKWAKTQLETVKFLPNTDSKRFSLEQNSVINSLHASLIKDNLFIGNKTGETSILALRVTSENELFSKYFAEALEEEVSEFYTETKIKKSSTNLAHLEHQADSVRNALYLAFKSVAAFSDAVPNLNSSRQV